MTYTIIGVIGHIDHGKSTLVRTLTGIDTDSLAEEKRRGITIDLGFASFSEGQNQFALIDAPGHQKYIGNLLVGVSALDLGMLIVACDQGIQEQTLEHASIVRALGIKDLVAVVTRIDLASQSAVAEVSQELPVFLADLGFSDVPILHVSAVTGEGISELKSWLCDFANNRKIPREYANALAADVRMPVDRALNIEGRGVVVAGTIWSGNIRIGDMLQLAGTEKKFRVRELEVHGDHVEFSSAGKRTAVNIVGLGNEKVKRGDELISIGSHPLRQNLVISFNTFGETPKIRFPCTAQIHTATCACDAKIIGTKRTGDGNSVAIVTLSEPVVAVYMQPCLFRSPHPVNSFAGGHILAAFAESRFKNKNLFDFGLKLVNGDAAQRLLAWTDLYGELVLDRQWCREQVGIQEHELANTVHSILEANLAMWIGKRLVSLVCYDRTKHFLESNLLERTKGMRQAWVAEKSLTEQALSIGSSELVEWALTKLVEGGRILRINGMVASSTIYNALTKKQRAQLEQLLASLADSRTPPTLKEIADQLRMSSDATSSLARFAVQQGMLIDLGKGFLIASSVYRTMIGELAAIMAVEPEVSVSTIRDHWQITRKHAIPLLEYCDREQITIRTGDFRTAGRKLIQVLEGSQAIRE